MRVSFLSSRFFGASAAVLFAAQLAAGCAGRSLSNPSDDDDPQGGSSGAAASAGANGGTFAKGGTGGTDTGKGGDFASAGKPDVGGTGGTDVPGKGGSAMGGTGGTVPNCEGIKCEPLPKTCKAIVQPEDACCPICKEDGCGECTVPDCDEGYHAERLPGDCCETCVQDPLDACEQGLQAYIQLRDAIVEKYSSSSCQNSSECGLVQEDNACVANPCAYSIPKSLIESFETNIAASAKGCSTCSSLREPPPLCMPVVAACVNGRCTTATAP